jgi:hypothetical protein
MARRRRVGDILTFTPPSFLGGAARVFDLFGVVPDHTGPPRLRYVKRKQKAKRHGAILTDSVMSALARDVKAVGSDIRRSIDEYDRTLQTSAR